MAAPLPLTADTAIPIIDRSARNERYSLAIRSLTSEFARQDLDGLLEQVRDSGDKVVLSVDGKPTAMVVPLTGHAQQELLRESFGRFWDAHKAYQRENPPPARSEEEIMEEALEIQREIRAEKEAERSRPKLPAKRWA